MRQHDNDSRGQLDAIARVVYRRPSNLLLFLFIVGLGNHSISVNWASVTHRARILTL